jgi:hypothetical protein
MDDDGKLKEDVSRNQAGPKSGLWGLWLQGNHRLGQGID